MTWLRNHLALVGYLVLAVGVAAALGLSAQNTTRINDETRDRAAQVANETKARATALAAEADNRAAALAIETARSDAAICDGQNVVKAKILGFLRALANGSTQSTPVPAGLPDAYRQFVEDSRAQQRASYRRTLDDATAAFALAPCKK